MTEGRNQQDRISETSSFLPCLVPWTTYLQDVTEERSPVSSTRLLERSRVAKGSNSVNSMIFEPYEVLRILLSRLSSQPLGKPSCTPL